MRPFYTDSQRVIKKFFQKNLQKNLTESKGAVPYSSFSWHFRRGFSCSYRVVPGFLGDRSLTFI